MAMLRIDPTRKFPYPPFPHQAKLFDGFVERLRPDPLAQQKANKCIATIFKKLDEKDQEGSLSIDRRIVAGSAGKRTAIRGSDHDLIVFLNSELPPFERVLERLKTKLETLPGFIYTRTTPYSIQFELDGLHFDLLPAVNFRAGTAGKTAEFDPQLFEALMERPKYSSIGEFNRSLGSSLTEFNVDFVVRQGAYVHKVIRLAKFWNQLVDVGGVYISGRSSIIELVAIWSNKDNSQYQYGGQSVMEGFTRFLLSMQSFGALEIRFNNHIYGSVPYAIRNQRPLILDPSNPNNNLAYGIKPGTINIFQTSARQTLEKIEGLYGKSADPNIETLIDPAK